MTHLCLVLLQPQGDSVLAKVEQEITALNTSEERLDELRLHHKESR
jgi:hypothetical protein